MQAKAKPMAAMQNIATAAAQRTSTGMLVHHSGTCQQ